MLSLDATVVLLTPIVFATAARLRARAKPYVYGTTHLANSASLLLPVSNLTNLIAFAASGLSFPRFAGLMLVPWLAAIAVEYLVFRRFFRTDLNVTPAPSQAAETAGVPVFALIVLALTLAGFAVASLSRRQPRLGGRGGSGGTRGPGAGPAAHHAGGDLAGRGASRSSPSCSHSASWSRR